MGNHELNWSTATPGCLVFLLDCSGSMGNPFGNTTRTVASVKALNSTIQNILEVSLSGDIIKRRCHIDVIGYEDEVEPLLKGWIDELEPIAGESYILPPKIKGGLTNMYGAFVMAKRICEDFMRSYPDSPAPIIINITDGEPLYGICRDGIQIPSYDSARCMQETMNIVHEIMQMGNADGKIWVFNAAIRDDVDSVSFPASKEIFSKTDKYARFIFDISSDHVGRDFPKEARACVIGSEASDLVTLIEFGSCKATDTY